MKRKYLQSEYLLKRPVLHSHLNSIFSTLYIYQMKLVSISLRKTFYNAKVQKTEKSNYLQQMGGGW